MTLTQFIILSSIMFCIGVYGLLSKRNVIMVLMSIELMLNAVNLNFVAVSQYNKNVSGNVFAIFIIALAAAEVAIGIAIMLKVYSHFKSVNIDEIETLSKEGN